MAKRKPCPHCGFTLDGKPHHRGRPTKLTAEVKAAIVKALEAGNYLETAAIAAGVTRLLVYEWLRQARTGREPYAAFAEAVERARAKAEIDMLAELRLAGTDEFGAKRAARHIEWILERTRRERFGPTVRIEVETAKERLLNVAQRTLEASAFAELLEALERDGEAVPEEVSDPEPRPALTN